VPRLHRSLELFARLSLGIRQPRRFDPASLLRSFNVSTHDDTPFKRVVRPPSHRNADAPTFLEKIDTIRWQLSKICGQITRVPRVQRARNKQNLRSDANFFISQRPLRVFFRKYGKRRRRKIIIWVVLIIGRFKGLLSSGCFQTRSPKTKAGARASACCLDRLPNENVFFSYPSKSSGARPTSQYRNAEGPSDKSHRDWMHLRIRTCC